MSPGPRALSQGRTAPAQVNNSIPSTLYLGTYLALPDPGSEPCKCNLQPSMVDWYLILPGTVSILTSRRKMSPSPRTPLYPLDCCSPWVKRKNHLSMPLGLLECSLIKGLLPSLGLLQDGLCGSKGAGPPRSLLKVVSQAS